MEDWGTYGGDSPAPKNPIKGATLMVSLNYVEITSRKPLTLVAMH